MDPETFADQLPGIVQSAAQRALQLATLVVEGSAKREVPVRTGTLRRSLVSRVEPTRGIVGTNLNYAPIVHARNPFLIRAVEKNRRRIEQILADAGERLFTQVSR